MLIARIIGRPARLSGVNWIGIAVGMLGVAALVGLEVGGSDLLAVGEVAIVVVGYALGPAILARWMSDLPGIGITAVSLAIAAIVYVPFVLFTGAWPSAWPSAEAIWSIIVLAVVCSALAFILMVALIGEVGPVKSTAITYINPAVAIVAGVLILGEPLTVWTIVGFVLVLGGSYLVTMRRRDAVAPAGPEEAVAEETAAAEPISSEEAKRAGPS